MLDNTTIDRGTICIEDIAIGMSRHVEKTIEDYDIRAFAEISTDHNPVHLDEGYAQETIFGGRIAHGMLTAALISAVIGEQLPGHGTIYLGQSLKFRAPVRPGDTVRAEVRVADIDYAKRRVTLDCTCRVGDTTVLEGDALVLAPTKKFDDGRPTAPTQGRWMRIIEGYRDVDPADRGAAVAIGNFDGVHRGHQILIDDADRARRTPCGPLGVVTFEPHPRRHFQPDAPPFCLTTPTAKARLLRRYGVELLYRLTFDAALAGMAAEDFVRGVLYRGLGVSHVVVGADFHFGKGRKGDAVLLRNMGTELGFGVTIHELIGDETGEFASTALRVLIEDGRCEEAARQLGRWHTLTGPVIRGDERGRDLGYPTANLAFDEQLIPRYGIYAAWVDVLAGPHEGRYPGVVSLGERPTFGVNAPNFEVHIFDFDGDLYGTEISVSLVHYLRGELKFDGADALIAQMDRDSAEARAVLADARLPEA